MRKHGGDVYVYRDKYENILDFSANINAFIDTGILSRYPEVSLDDIEKIILRYTGSKSLHAMIGPGLTHFIYRIPVWMRLKRSLIIEPNFNEYEASLLAHGSRTSSLGLELLKRNPEIVRSYRPDSIFICSPVNPTGDVVDAKLIRKLSSEMNRIGGIVFVDQAFGDFVPEHAEEIVGIAEEMGNVIIGRSLTKILAIPSLRLGYILVSDQVYGMIRDKEEPWAVCEPALEFVRKTDLRALRDISLKRISAERSYLMEALERAGFEILGDPHANFIAFRSPFNIDLKKQLLKSGILIRSLSDYADFGENCYRVAVRTRSENALLIQALKTAISQ